LRGLEVLPGSAAQQWTESEVVRRGIGRARGSFAAMGAVQQAEPPCSFLQPGMRRPESKARAGPQDAEEAANFRAEAPLFDCFQKGPDWSAMRDFSCYLLGAVCVLSFLEGGSMFC